MVLNVTHDFSELPASPGLPRSAWLEIPLFQSEHFGLREGGQNAALRLEAEILADIELLFPRLEAGLEKSRVRNLLINPHLQLNEGDLAWTSKLGQLARTCADTEIRVAAIGALELLSTRNPLLVDTLVDLLHDRNIEVACAAACVFARDPIKTKLAGPVLWQALSECPVPNQRRGEEAFRAEAEYAWQLSIAAGHTDARAVKPLLECLTKLTLYRIEPYYEAPLIALRNLKHEAACAAESLVPYVFRTEIRRPEIVWETIAALDPSMIALACSDLIAEPEEARKLQALKGLVSFAQKNHRFFQDGAPKLYDNALAVFNRGYPVDALLYQALIPLAQELTGQLENELRSNSSTRVNFALNVLLKFDRAPLSLYKAICDLGFSSPRYFSKTIDILEKMGPSGWLLAAKYLREKIAGAEQSPSPAIAIMSTLGESGRLQLEILATEHPDQIIRERCKLAVLALNSRHPRDG